MCQASAVRQTSTSSFREDATVANRYTYTAYDTTTVAASAIKNPLRYISGYHDAETIGLYKLGIR